MNSFSGTQRFLSTASVIFVFAALYKQLIKRAALHNAPTVNQELCFATRVTPVPQPLFELRAGREDANAGRLRRPS